MAVDLVWDSKSIATTFREELFKAGVIFCSFSEAVKEYPDIVQKYMSSVVRSSGPQGCHTRHKIITSKA